MISVEEARDELDAARAHHDAIGFHCSNQERHRRRMRVVRAEDALRAAEYRERFTQVHDEVSVERSPNGLLLHMPSVEFVAFSPGELVELGRQLVEIGAKS